jgi:IS30 family transposase
VTTLQYKQLQPEEQVTIASLKQQGRGVRAIARVLERPASTISRELRRNAISGKGYASGPAQEAACTRRVRARRWPKLHPQGKLWRWFRRAWRGVGRPNK